MVSAREIADILGGPKTLGRRVANMMDLDELVAEGIPRPAFDTLLERIAEEDTRVVLRNRIIPRATYQRSTRLNAAYSQTAERLARVYAITRAVWQDEERARRFLTTPHPELRGKTPMEAALTEIGGREVEELIERGLHGLPV